MPNIIGPKLLKNTFFFFSFWAKLDSYDVYLKYGLVSKSSL